MDEKKKSVLRLIIVIGILTIAVILLLTFLVMQVLIARGCATPSLRLTLSTMTIVSFTITFVAGMIQIFRRFKNK